jgi:hypothetical protein
MGTIFTISDGIRNLAKDAFSDLINQLGKPCKLIFPPKMTACANCIPDPIGNKSSNRYNTGGPAPFPMGSICPVCGGKGQIATENSRVVTLLINEDPKQFDKSLQLNNSNIYYPDGTIQAKGFIADLPDVLKCTEMIKDTNIQPYIEYRYKRYGEPLSPGNIVQGAFFISLWTRV